MIKKQFYDVENFNDTFIFPAGVWQCWICQREKIHMSVIELDSEMVALVCVPCGRDLVKAINEKIIDGILMEI
jgi:hypothetical protein